MHLGDLSLLISKDTKYSTDSAGVSQCNYCKSELDKLITSHGGDDA